jgi:hypothetical protein
MQWFITASSSSSHYSHDHDLYINQEFDRLAPPRDRWQTHALDVCTCHTPKLALRGLDPPPVVEQISGPALAEWWVAQRPAMAPRAPVSSRHRPEVPQQGQPVSAAVTTGTAGAASLLSDPGGDRPSDAFPERATLLSDANAPGLSIPGGDRPSDAFPASAAAALPPPPPLLCGRLPSVDSPGSRPPSAVARLGGPLRIPVPSLSNALSGGVAPASIAVPSGYQTLSNGDGPRVRTSSSEEAAAAADEEEEGDDFDIDDDDDLRLAIRLSMQEAKLLQDAENGATTRELQAAGQGPSVSEAALPSPTHIIDVAPPYSKPLDHAGGGATQVALSARVFSEPPSVIPRTSQLPAQSSNRLSPPLSPPFVPAVASSPDARPPLDSVREEEYSSDDGGGRLGGDEDDSDSYVMTSRSRRNVTAISSAPDEAMQVFSGRRGGLLALSTPPRDKQVELIGQIVELCGVSEADAGHLLQKQFWNVEDVVADFYAD